MTYTIQKHITKVNKGQAGANSPQWLIVHFVGASGQAWDNANYFYSTYREASAHYFVDKNNILQVVPDNAPAWHCGDAYNSGVGKHNGYYGHGTTNNNSIGIEICQDTSIRIDGINDVWHWDFNPASLDRAEWLIKKLQKQYGIDDSHVIRHYDVSSKMCPGNWQYDNWSRWHDFKKRLAGVKQTAKAGANKQEGKAQVSGMYTIQVGDTLSSIAKAHGVTVNDLQNWNDISDPNIIFPETKIFVSNPKVEVKGSLDKMAQDTIKGYYGSGDQRKQALGADYDAVQARVNQILLGTSAKPAKTTEQLAREVIEGKHGSGDQRIANLGSRYSEVQARVNEILGGKSDYNRIKQLADKVELGLYGNGDYRKQSLGKDYDAVQKEINRRYK